MLCRVGDTQAVGVDRRMRASFPQLANRLLSNAVEKAAGEVRREGDNQSGYSYVIEFSQPSGLDAAAMHGESQPNGPEPGRLAKRA